jgi:hypothetical protein
MLVRSAMVGAAMTGLVASTTLPLPVVGAAEIAVTRPLASIVDRRQDSRGRRDDVGQGKQWGFGAVIVHGLPASIVTERPVQRLSAPIAADDR